MGLQNFAFVPPTGLEDQNEYPTTPATEEDFRSAVQAPSNQVKTYLNDTIVPMLTNMVIGNLATDKANIKIKIDALGKALEIKTCRAYVNALSGSVSFDAAFAEKCIAAFAFPEKNTLENYATSVRVESPEKTGFTWESFLGDTGTKTTYLTYVAIGY